MTEQEKCQDHIEITKRSAMLCKTDLISNCVKEFPELQGIIGYYLALKDGERPAVALTIREHYLPKFEGDELPTSIPGISLAIADRIDDIVINFGLGRKPTGQKDAYGVRRSAIGILRIIIDKNLPLDLMDLLSISKKQIPQINPDIEEMMDFFFERLRTIFKAQGIKNNIFEAVLSKKPTKPLEFKERIEALDHFLTFDISETLLMANKRAKNIIKEGAKKRGLPAMEELNETEFLILNQIMVLVGDYPNGNILLSHAFFSIKLNKYLEEFDYKNADDNKLNFRFYLCLMFRKMVNHTFSLDLVG